MSLLLFAYRHQSIICRKSEINQKLLDLRKRQMDLQSYSASIADGTVSMNDLMSCPASVFMRMNNFMQYSHQQSMMGAQQNIGGMLAMFQASGGMANLNPQMQQQYQQMIFKNLYDKERERFSRQEEKVLNVEDKKIEQQIAQLNTQLQMLEAEEKNVSQAESESAKDSAPTFGNSR